MWLAGNPKLKVTEYSRQLYGGADVGDDDDGGGGGGSKSTPSHHPRKRHFQ